MGTRPIASRRTRLGLSEKAVSALLIAVAALFMIAGLITLYLAPGLEGLDVRHLLAVGLGWAVAWGGSLWLLSSRLEAFDRILIALVALLTGWGLLMQARLAPGRLYRQVLWLLIGCGVMSAAALTPGLTRLLRRYRYTLLTAGILLLGATLVFGVNPSGYGQELWLGAFGIYVQPSEPLKLLLVIYLAAYLSDRRDVLKTQGTARPTWMAVLGPMVVMVGVALLLLGWQQDLGAALLFYLTFVMMIFLAWGNGWYVLVSLVLFLPVGLAGYLLSDRVALRVSIWLDPWTPAQADRAFQILQSLFAFGAGGLFGQGLGEGAPGLIPAVHTDFVYAALAEEFGLIGTLAVLLLIAAVIYRGIRLAQRSESTFESLVAGGIAALIGVQTWVIAGGNAKLIPITGVTFPFMSYGGSSLLTMMAAIGLLLNLSAPHAAPLSLTLAPNVSRPLRDTAGRLGRGILVLFASLSLITGLWSLVRSRDLQQYVSNPRLILAENRIRRGRILDRNGEPLADITLDDEGYVTRRYPLPEAAPVVGFSNLAYGTDGVEAACDARLRGDVGVTPWDAFRRSLLHVDPVGRDVRLTIDARLQTYLQDRLQGLTGAAVLIDARTGEILALGSSPVYNSATVVEEWPELSTAANSPFFNRATQGLAQPGTSLQPFILASALQRTPDLMPTAPITSPVTFNGLTVACTRAVDDDSWSAALSAACPTPFKQAARGMGSTAFTESLARWGFLDAPALTVPTVAADIQDRPIEPAEEALGQGNLLVTPLQMVQAMAALGNDGLRPTLSLLDTPLDGCTPISPTVGPGVRVVDALTAEQVRQMLESYPGAVGHLGTSFAGPNRQQAWFVGLNSASVPRYAVAVFIDQMEDPNVAAEIGTDLLRLLPELQRSETSSPN